MANNIRNPLLISLMDNQNGKWSVYWAQGNSATNFST